MELPFIKIGSGDNNNYLMLEMIAGDLSPIPVFISTGMQSIDGIKKIYSIFKNRKDLALLHCISSYPTKAEDTYLRFIEVFKELFPTAVIGYSGHEITSIAISLGAVALGAKIIERHITLDKMFKGNGNIIYYAIYISVFM